MINTYLKYAAKYKDSADAILIANRDGIIEYSALLSDKSKGFVSEGIVGKHILEIYPSLTEETSSHTRVLNTGKPIINEEQTIVDKKGHVIKVINSTFPIFAKNGIIGTIEMTIFLENNLAVKEEKRDILFTVDNIISCNKAMEKLKIRMLQLAATDNSVLLIGNTGSGKELFAQALHYHSMRSGGPFVSINVAAIPENLVESTLFGTERGSFTGAVDKGGLFEEAHMGTLFLDELNSMDLNIQAKILRAIETRRIRKVGGTKDILLDIRFISAMNVSGEQAVKQKTLRSDLFFRLAASQLYIPSLKDRIEDLELLTEHFLKEPYQMSSMVKNLFEEYDWPGNVREFRNALEFAMSVATTSIITVQDIPEYILFNRLSEVVLESDMNGKSLAEMTGSFEKKIIEKVLRECKTLTAASNKLRLTRQALKYKMNKYEIEW